MMASTSSCVAQSKLFKEAAKYEGVTTVYISPMMCRMAMSAGKSVSGIDGIGDGIKKLHKVEIVECENANSIEKVAEICHAIVERMNMEILTEVNEDKKYVAIFTHPDATGDALRDIIIEAREPGEYTMVYIEGEFDLREIMESVSQIHVSDCDKDYGDPDD